MIQINETIIRRLSRQQRTLVEIFLDILLDQTGTFQFREALRNALLNQFSTGAVGGGTAVSLIVRTLTQPADCSQANAGSSIVDMTLPNPFMNAASAGQKTKAGTWSGTAAGGGPFTAAHFRMYDSQATKDGTTCFAQGNVGQGTGDLSLDNTTIASGQTVTISTFTLNAGNA